MSAARDQLKAPSTATFPRHPDEVRRTPGAPTAFLHGHVEAQNSFGVTLGNEFICKMTQDGNRWTVAVAFDEP